MLFCLVRSKLRCRVQGPTQTKNIVLNGQTFPIRINLWNFLEVFQTYQDAYSTWIWIDQICVNQLDLDERSFQIRLMQSIYSNTVETYAWLGKCANAEDDRGLTVFSKLVLGNDRHGRSALVPVGTFARRHDNQDNVYYEDGTYALVEAEHRAMIEVFNASYWTRLWIAQELLLSRHVAVCRGTSTVSWTCIRSVAGESAKWYSGTASEDIQDECLSSKRFIKDSECLRTLHSLADWFRLSIYDDLRVWQELAHVAKSSHCQDPRDRVYGTQALLNPAVAVNIKADYSQPVRAVYRQAVSAYEACYFRKCVGMHEKCDDIADQCAALAVAMGLDVRGEFVESMTRFLLTRRSMIEVKNKTKLFRIIDELVFETKESKVATSSRWNRLGQLLH